MMGKDSVQTAVTGVSGYAGLELARLLLHHPALRGRAPLFFGRDADPVRLTDIHPQLAAAAAAAQNKSVYGSPELHRQDIRNAQLVANPGCYATSIILAVKPLVAAGWVDLDHGIICDSKSGVSGAGKAPSATTHFMYAADNLSAYAVFGHRHLGEMMEQLEVKESQIIFTPHLLPIPRGILSTTYVTFREKKKTEEVDACFREFYATSPMVRIFNHLPQIQYSVRTNYCDIGFKLAHDGRRCIVVSCLDNLLKGAAGQAIENMNLMCGWDEAEGLA
jgi:N-acetyl-gamma-glutamyl-phosphate reductase